MDEVTSSEFRKTYAKLSSPTVVTAGGRPIGQWIPVGYALTVQVDGDAVTIDPPPMRDQRVVVETRINGQPFNSRGSRPVPKK